MDFTTFVRLVLHEAELRNFNLTEAEKMSAVIEGEKRREEPIRPGLPLEALEETSLGLGGIAAIYNSLSPAEKETFRTCQRPEWE